MVLSMTGSQEERGLFSPTLSSSARDLRPSLLAQYPSRGWTGRMLGLTWLSSLGTVPRAPLRCRKWDFHSRREQQCELSPKLANLVVLGVADPGRWRAGPWSRHGSRTQSLIGDGGGIFQHWHSFYVAAVAVTMSKLSE